MEKRPFLTTSLSVKEFREYYYLKEELLSFCKENKLQTRGNKKELTERIAYFLETGKNQTTQYKSTKVLLKELSLETVIETPFVCSEKHREFYKKHIGKTFSFNVLFQKWLKENSGKTYQESIQAYYEILEVKKANKSKIGKQFEYNKYIRDFFEDNKDRTLEDAILCWKHKKSLKGHNRYEKIDLKILN